MRFGVHLPLIDFGDGSPSLDELERIAGAAAGLGFSAVAANDHLVFRRPWLDGPTALAAVLRESGDLDLMTTVALPVIRGPVALAKTVASLDVLSGGRLIVGVGPGSSPSDYAAVGLDFDERWRRLDEAVATMRALLVDGAAPFTGNSYSTAGLELEPAPTHPQGPPIWIGSWGSPAGLRRVARAADGWLASAYNTTPDDFAEAKGRLATLLTEEGKDSEAFPCALATGFLHLTDSHREATDVLESALAPALNRPPDELRDRLFVGTPDEVIEKVDAYRSAGLDRLLVWPVRDHLAQLERFATEVAATSEAS